MNQYLSLLQNLMANGVRKTSRGVVGATGAAAATRSLFAEQLRFDLQAGFPLMTTKRVAWKAVVVELLWFLRGDTNTTFLTDNGVTIWNEWRQPYSLDRDAVLIEPRPAVRAPHKGTFSTAGLDAAGDSVDGKLASAWVKMMRRCYDTEHHRYALYGAQGATVHPRWHDVRTFVVDVKLLPHWGYKLAAWEQFELDKDYYGAREYGPDTSVWLRTDENNAYSKAASPVTVRTPTGDAQTFVSLNAAARAIGMAPSTLCRFLVKGVPSILKGKNKAFAGWEFEHSDLDGKLLRYELIPDNELGPVYGRQWRDWNGIDQIANLIDGLRKNPDGRRHIVSAWNVTDIPKMALPPCHCLAQFYVADGKLSCQLYQRSADIFLGVPFNIASYALLTHMVAAQTGLEVGSLIVTFGDVHLYENHVEAAVEQLSRTPGELPKLVLMPADSIDAYTLDHVQLIGYKPQGKIAADVVV